VGRLLLELPEGGQKLELLERLLYRLQGAAADNSLAVQALDEVVVGK
jgi:hypothetical protein